MSELEIIQNYREEITMKGKKFVAVALAAAMLTSAFCSLGSVTANAVTSDAELYSSYATYDGGDLGANYTSTATTFKLWAPSSTDAAVRLYNAGSDTEEGADPNGTFIAEHTMTYDAATGVWSVTVDGDLKNVYYTYSLKNDLNPDGVEVVDLYAKAAGVNGNRGMVVDLDSTDPQGWSEDNFQRAEEATDAIVWEVHIKDFSYDEESGVSDANRGKYMAFTELETTLNNAGDTKTCMNYLKDLGITYVQINPMYDFGSVDESGDDTQFNWGYDPKNYNVPEGSYSTNPYDGNVRINEMKQMILALHEAGIGVIMDVVYNHTYASEDSWFNLTVPGYYYRHTATGAWSNGSGCGNDTASEREMFKNYMVDSITYWATEYHLDGFRFDLMGLHDCDTMNAVRDALDQIDPAIITYGEGWTMGTANDTYNWTGEKTTLCTQAKAMRVNQRIGFFNDDARDALKGKAFDDLTSRGYVSGSTSFANDLYKSIQGHYTNSNWKTQVPGQNVMYADCHDNQTLYDRLVASCYGLDGDYSKRYEALVSMNKLSSAIVLTSQGISFLLAGEEFCRTKYGDHNSYKSSPDINMLDWSRVEEYADVVSYYKGMIAIRKNFAAFTDGTQTSGRAMEKLETPKGVIGYSLANLEAYANNGQWDKVLVYFNSSLTDSAEITLPGVSGGSVLLGDVSGNGKLGTDDALTIARSIAGLVKLTDEQTVAADANGDGKVTSIDVLTVQRVLAGLEESKTLEGNGEYVVVANKYETGFANITTLSGTISMDPNSALILVPVDTFNANPIAEEETARVVVNHVDKATGQTLCQTVIKGVPGQKYSTQMAQDLLIEYDYDSCSTNAEGVMTEGITEVFYYYNLFEGGIGTLTVKYLDENGKELADPVVSTARAGTEYETEPKLFSWQQIDMDKYPTNATGVYTGGETEVVYYYKTVTEAVTNTIHVKVVDDSFAPCLYIWDTKGTISKGWPGTKLTDTDGDGWFDITFENGIVYNWILNDGNGTQTADMTGSGDLWIVAEGSPQTFEVYSSNPGI